MNKTHSITPPADMAIGTIHQTNRCGELEIVAYNGAYNVSVRFIDTGTIKTAKASNIRRGLVADPLARTVYGVGYLDGAPAKSDGRRTDAYTTWRSMLERCYCPKFLARRPTYSDCIVCDEWHSLANFEKWFDDHYITGYHLDKDKLIQGNKVYSPDTCCFISGAENTQISHNIPCRLHHEQHGTHEAPSRAQFARDWGLHSGDLNNVINGKRGHTKGWRLVN